MTLTAAPDTRPAPAEHDARFDLCICSFPRWRHPTNEVDRLIVLRTTIGSPHHLFIEPVEPPNIVRFLRLPNGRLSRIPSPEPAP